MKGNPNLTLSPLMWQCKVFSLLRRTAACMHDWKPQSANHPDLFQSVVQVFPGDSRNQNLLAAGFFPLNNLQKGFGDIKGFCKKLEAFSIGFALHWR